MDSRYHPRPWQGLDDLYDRIDSGIRREVRILREHGIETTESCEGTYGHCYPEPTVCFQGTYEAGFRALALCYTHGLRVKVLRRVWEIIEGEPSGPSWELVFYHPDGGGMHPVEQPDGTYIYRWGTSPIIDAQQAGEVG